MAACLSCYRSRPAAGGDCPGCGVRYVSCAGCSASNPDYFCYCLRCAAELPRVAIARLAAVVAARLPDDLSGSHFGRLELRSIVRSDAVSDYYAANHEVRLDEAYIVLAMNAPAARDCDAVAAFLERATALSAANDPAISTDELITFGSGRDSRPALVLALHGTPSIDDVIAFVERGTVSAA